MTFIKEHLICDRPHKEIVLCRGMYGTESPTAETILKDVLKQNRSVVVLHVSEYLYEEWTKTFEQLDMLATERGIQLFFDLKSKEECDKTIEARKKSSNGLVPTKVIDNALCGFSKT